MLRKINLERLSDDNIFVPLSEEEYDMIPVDHRIIRHSYWRAIFVQFDIPSDFQNYKNYIYHNLFKHARSNFTGKSIKCCQKMN